MTTTETTVETDGGLAPGLAARLSQLREGSQPKSKLKQRTHFWTRWLHVYTSLFSLLVVLFFGITGVTLNHPSWTFGTDATNTTYEGTLPAEAFGGSEVEFLTVSQFVRAEHGVKGDVTNFGVDGETGTISFKSPGYGAELFFEVPDHTYSLTVQQQGWITVFNDLHKGRDSNTSWRWLIDVSGALLVVVSLTGLFMQFFMRKRRMSGLTLAGIGTVITVALIWYAMSV